MGTSSTFSTSNTHVKYNITVNQNLQNVSNNCSNVSVYVKFWRDNSGYTTYGSGTCYCKINGTTYSATVSPSQKITDSGINLFSKTLDIYHNNDGTKTLTCSAWISMDTPLSSNEQSYSQTLSTIPRASKPTLSSSSVTMGNSVTVSTNRASSSFTHYLLAHSFYAKAISVKKVTTNKSKKTAGIDKVIWKSAKAKMQATLSLTDKNYKAQPLRRVYINKKNKNKKTARNTYNV